MFVRGYTRPWCGRSGRTKVVPFPPPRPCPPPSPMIRVHSRWGGTPSSVMVIDIMTNNRAATAAATTATVAARMQAMHCGFGRAVFTGSLVQQRNLLQGCCCSSHLASQQHRPHRGCTTSVSGQKNNRTNHAGKSHIFICF